MAEANNGKKEVLAIKDWNAVREVARLGYNDAILSLAMVETLERSNKPSCVQAVNSAKANLAAWMIRGGLLFRLHMFITRGFAPVHREDDRHLRAAIEFLRRQPNFDGMKHPEQPLLLLDALADFDTTSTDTRLERLKLMRDKQLAHMASYDENNRPTFNDLFHITQATAKIWQNLAMGSAVILIEVETQLVAYRRSADRFWSQFDHVREMNDDDQFDHLSLEKASDISDSEFDIQDSFE